MTSQTLNAIVAARVRNLAARTALHEGLEREIDNRWSRALFLCSALLAMSSCGIWAQSSMQTPAGPTRPTQVPLSGRSSESFSVSAEQETTTGTSKNSIVTTTSSVNVQGVYAGGVSSGVATPGVLPLSLKDALSRALRVNLGVVTQSAAVDQAQGQRLIARSDLLPQLNTVVSEQFERENLRELGVVSSLGPFPEAVRFTSSMREPLDCRNPSLTSFECATSAVQQTH